MSRSKETFGKKEVRNKQLKKRKDKAQRKLERKEQGKTNFDDMIAWVDENGNIVAEPPSTEKKEEIKAEDIEVSVPKGGYIKEEPIHNGRVDNYDQQKGFGFIMCPDFKSAVFFHINDCYPEVKRDDKVSFETEMGPKGLKAINVQKKS